MNTLKSATIMALTATFGAAFAQNGAVFTETNSAGGNSVLAYSRTSRGELSFVGAFETGGLGTGGGLGSQNALNLSRDGRTLYAVDAGSNDVAVFSVGGANLRLIGRYASGGASPISVTAHDGWVYVLNAGGSGNISGFWAAPDGSLTSIPGSVRPLSGPATGPAQIQFSPDGSTLVVTEKATNRIDSWPISGGVPGDLQITASSGPTPFGFDFDNDGRLFVSEAFGGAAGASAASTYGLGSAGVSAISPSSPTFQTAACWAAVSPNGRFGYTANAGSNTLTGFSIGEDGSLTLITPGGATAATGSHPIDLAFSRNGRFLYSLANVSGEIVEYRFAADGTLSRIGSIAGLPASAQGLAAN